jgi:hypothetical protein
MDWGCRYRTKYPSFLTNMNRTEPQAIGEDGLERLDMGVAGEALFDAFHLGLQGLACVCNGLACNVRFDHYSLPCSESKYDHSVTMRHYCAVACIAGDGPSSTQVLTRAHSRIL